MVVYLDLTFFLNALTDLAALSATAKLSGLPLRRRRLLGASVLGGGYGAPCLLPPLPFAGGLLPQAGAAMALVWIAFRRRDAFFRQLLLFWLLSCAMGGALLAAARLWQRGAGAAAVLSQLNWRVFLLAGGGCYLLLSVIFRGGARHALAGELVPCAVQRAGKGVRLQALLDSGHTLTDLATGAPVLIAEAAALEELWTPAEARVLTQLGERGAPWCLSHLEEPGGFRLLPYRAVGVEQGMLLCFTADSAAVGGKNLGPTTVALSPTAVSSEGGYAALWSGKEGGTSYAP